MLDSKDVFLRMRLNEMGFSFEAECTILLMMQKSLFMKLYKEDKERLIDMMLHSLRDTLRKELDMFVEEMRKKSLLIEEGSE